MCYNQQKVMQNTPKQVHGNIIIIGDTSETEMRD